MLFVVGALVGLLLLVKVTCFLADTTWLWFKGPSLRLHAVHRGTSMSDIEWSTEVCGGDCQERIPGRNPWMALKFSQVAWPNAGGRLRRLAELVFWTPTLALSSACLVPLAGGSGTGRAVSVVAGFLAGLLALLSLAAAIVVRLSLGDRDVEYSDLVKFRKLMSRAEAAPRVVARTSLGAYFVVLFGVSVLLFGALYSGLYAGWHNSLQLNGSGHNPVDWFYWSVSVASTSGLSGISAGSRLAELACSLQLLSGPMLLLWFLALLLSE